MKIFKEIPGLKEEELVGFRALQHEVNLIDRILKNLTPMTITFFAVEALAEAGLPMILAFRDHPYFLSILHETVYLSAVVTF